MVTIEDIAGEVEAIENASERTRAANFFGVKSPREGYRDGPAKERK